MEQVIVSLVVALAQLIPTAIEAIKASEKLSADEKKQALDALQASLEKTRAAVAAVTFRDLDQI